MIRTVTFLIVVLSLQFSFSQSLNSVYKDDKGNSFLLGEINREDLKAGSFKTWFTKNYDHYLVNKNITKRLKDSLNLYEIKVFLGTWCGDSKREVPRFYNVLDVAKFPEKQLSLIAVNRTEYAYKQSPNHEEQGLNIHRVPTFIFYKKGKEVNRIVEFPVETFERDIFKIVNHEKYTPNYAVAEYMDYLLQKRPIDSLKLDEDLLVSRISNYTKGSRELNTYGYSLLRSNQTEKALYIFNLNAKVFPYKHNVYDSLGEAYFKTKNYTEALKNYYNVLSLQPDNENAANMIEKVKSEQKNE